MSGVEFRFVDETTKYEGYVMRVAEATFADPDGAQFTRDIVYTQGAVGVVPLTIDNGVPTVTLVRQYRAPLRTELLEIPAGLRDIEGETPEEVGRRELIEEVGQTAATMTPLTSFLNAAGMTNQRTWLFLGENLTEVDRVADGPEEQWMTIERHPLHDLVARIGTDELSDAKTVIGLLLAQRHLSSRGSG